LAPLLTWSHDDNRTGWAALLGGADTDVSPYAAPARAQDLSGLPPAYIDVGDLDLFYEQDVHFADRLAAAGVPTELHVHPGCPHAFEMLAPMAAVSVRVMADRVRRLRSL
ncbi:MAG: alpha/beta hydrolase fold domain-containing protein, partial [Mycobacterium sp.]